MAGVSLLAQPIGGSIHSEQGVQDRDRAERMEEAAQHIVSRLETLAQEQCRAKKDIERRWLEDLQSYSGVYDADTTSRLNENPERSNAFINLTRPKTNAWRARLFDMLFPADDRNWDVGPTPVPELTETARLAVDESRKLHEEAELAAEQANQTTDPAQQQALMAEAQDKGARAKAFEEAEENARDVMDMAKRRGEAMRREIDDQLVESLYAPRARDVIDDAAKLGIGIFKGPMVASRPSRKWSKDDAGGYALSENPDARPEVRRVDPWHFFPDMSGSCPDEWEFTFERHLVTKKDLRKMTRTLGFDKDAVRLILNQDAPRTRPEGLDHLTQLRSISGETEQLKGRFVMWEYHGRLEYDDIITLMERMGKVEEAAQYREQYDPLEERMVVIHFCEGHVLKMSANYIMDSGETLYSVFCFERGEGSVMSAIGIPRIMMGAQKALNGAWRMMLDNAANSTVPQVVIDKQQVEPENNSWRLTPGKIWLKKSLEVATNNRPFEMFNIPINQAQLQGIIEMAMRFIDEETALPMIAQGEQGAHITQTANGMSMLFNSANVIFRRCAKNWDDDVTTPIIRRLYDFNMQFSEKDDVKGDMQVEARGTSVLLVREIQSQRLTAIASWTTHPIMGPAMRAYELMRLTLQTLSINPEDVLVPLDEYEKRMKAAAEAEAQGGESPDTIRAQATIEAAKISAESRAADGQVQLQIAEIRRETEILSLANNENIELSKVQAMLASTRMKSDSDERKLAAEIGVERQNATEARAMGEKPTGSGGAISAGTVRA